MDSSNVSGLKEGGEARTNKELFRSDTDTIDPNM